MTDFGGKLRQARERRGVSLRQIAANTKISAAALEALERNDVSRLPGGIFSRAFVRSYAIEVGLDPDETVKEFLERFQAEPPPSAVPVAVPEEESAFESQRRMASVLLILVVVSLAIGAVILYLQFRPSAEPEAAGVSAHAAAPAAAATPSPAAAEPPAVVEPPPASAAQKDTFRLEIHPTGACWIQLTVDGEVRLSRIVQPGERLAHNVRSTAVVEIGDAAAFAYSIDGREGRSLGGDGQVRTARITKETLADYLR